MNDDMNQPDSAGRVLVNVGHPPNEPDIFLAPQLGYSVKPHQVPRPTNRLARSLFLRPSAAVPTWRAVPSPELSRDG